MIISTNTKLPRSSMIHDPSSSKTKISTIKNTNYIQSSANLLYILEQKSFKIVARLVNYLSLYARPNIRRTIVEIYLKISDKSSTQTTHIHP